MHKAFKNFIKAVKDIKLSESEKGILRSKISEFMAFNPIRGEAHIPRERIYISIFELKHLAKATSLLLIFAIVAGGTGVSYAAQNALPGEKLYGIKVNVNEEIEEHLAFGAEAKAAVQTKKVERRLEEAQVLVKENKLSDNNKKIVEAKLDEHIKDLSHEIGILKEEGEVETVLETTAKLTPVLEAHKEILEESDSNKEDGDQDASTLIAKVDESIKTVEAEENDIIVAVALDAETQDSNATMAMSMTVEEDTEAKATKEAARALDDISDEIGSIVKSRIKAAKEKIQAIKIEEEKQEAALEESAKAQTETTATVEVKEETTVSPVTTLNKAISSNVIAPTTTATQQVEVVAETEEVVTEEAAVEENTGYDVMAKVKEAEKLIHEAEEKLERGNYKEALSLAQEVNRIAAEIETHKRLEALELAKANLLKASLKAEAVQSTK